MSIKNIKKIKQKRVKKTPASRKLQVPCQKTLLAKIKTLENLVKIIERGKRQWEATFDAIASPVMIVGKDYKIERANIFLANLIGAEIKKVVNRKCYQVFAGREEICVGCPVKEAVAIYRPCSNMLNNKIARKDFEAHAFPYLNREEVSEAVVMYYRDVTQENYLHQELIQNEKMAAIGLISGGIAHEINNPLAVILVSAQYLVENNRHNEALLSDLKKIETAAMQCKSVVRDLLDFARISKATDKLLMDINLVIEKMIPFIKADLALRNIELVLKLGSSLPNLNGRQDRIQQVLLNLFTNACHAMSQGGILTIASATNNKKEILVTVSDTGQGMDEEQLNRLFEPFYTTKQGDEGTGLGLSISKQIVQEHGGKIEVQSKKNKGTTFKLVFPGC
ncbi:MAG: ATP-binding protein [Pseudomonadota bacterium]